MEINSHSLFSKWFSESGKLVMKLFSHIDELAEDEGCLVVVLVDEVESITAARNSASRSNEPGDAVRVVNAVLTSLDMLRRRPNVLLLCTSNMVETVDSVSDNCHIQAQKKNNREHKSVWKTLTDSFRCHCFITRCFVQRTSASVSASKSQLFGTS
jgi:SpoVK/Ycf46/Vps4 family AAA+-type ATPase